MSNICLDISIIPVEGMDGFFELYVNGNKRRSKMSAKAIKQAVSSATHIALVEAGYAPCL